VLSFSEIIDMMRELARSIEVVSDGSDVPSDVVCMRSATEISRLLESLVLTQEKVEPYGLRMEGSEPHPDGVSGGGEKLRNVRYKTGSERKSQELTSSRLKQQAQARARTRKARKRGKRRVVKR